MRKIYRRSSYGKPDIKFNKTNQQIKSLEVQLIDETGEFLGTMTTVEALNIAAEKGLELVEINPTTKPPIAKIIDYGKFKYEQEKKQKKQKSQQVKVEIKGMRLTFRIGQHDLDVRKNQAIKHLTGGDKLKIEMMLKGRENKYVDLAKTTLINFINSINAEFPVKIEGTIQKLGTKLIVVIAGGQKAKVENQALSPKPKLT